eukprot:238665_1
MSFIICFLFGFLYLAHSIVHIHNEDKLPNGESRSSHFGKLPHNLNSFVKYDYNINKNGKPEVNKVTGLITRYDGARPNVDYPINGGEVGYNEQNAYRYDRGHIFAHQNGGVAGKINIVPQPKGWQQTGHWRKRELYIRKFLDKHDYVEVTTEIGDYDVDGVPTKYKDTIRMYDSNGKNEHEITLKAHLKKNAEGVYDSPIENMPPQPKIKHWFLGKKKAHTPSKKQPKKPPKKQPKKKPKKPPKKQPKKKPKKPPKKQPKKKPKKPPKKQQKKQPKKQPKK